MDKAFLRAYSQLLIQTCHRRGVHAMGGMAAQIPIKNDPAANEAALAKVRADKLREVTGRPRRHLGRASRAWCRSRRRCSTSTCRRRTRSTRKREDVQVTRGRSAAPARGRDHRGGPAAQHPRRHAVPRGVAARQGCVPLYNLMEDAATAEISRAQVWQWIHHGATLDDGRDGRRRALRAHPRRGAGSASATRSATSASRAAASTRRARSSTTSRAGRASRSSSRCPPTTNCSHSSNQERTDMDTLMKASTRPERPASDDWATRPALRAASSATYTAADVERLRGSIEDRAHARRARRASGCGTCSTPSRTSPRSARSPATRRCSRCAPASRRSTSPAGRSRPTRTSPGRCTPTRASIPSN